MNTYAPLAEVDRERAQQQYETEVDRQRRLIELYVQYGADRREVEEEYQAWLVAKQAELERATESSFAKMFREWSDTTNVMRDAGADWLDDLTDRFVNFVKTGKFAFADFAEAILADILRIQVQAAAAKMGTSIMDGIGNALSGITSGLFGTTGATSNVSTPLSLVGDRVPTVSNAQLGGIYHSGGIAGVENMQPIEKMFASARRYHNGGFAGLRSDEVAAKLRRGEGVFTEGQMKALGMNNARPVEVNVINQTGQQVDAKSQQRFDARGMILDIVLQAANQPGAFREGMKGAFGT
ncbi:hypothetical protein F1188_16345 [Roseospira marina]|uniref:Bacteriophage tail tape measure C-terminal domain-containing protein n=1 Tax=Roseospira marina TaxID=140057 RepID=A0A5M6I910_9PROT|nr:phage tail tape measure C-terminal domain-containing protein [Roseospira marina]KAA5604427.1 hypothetical protein F1188_16345 [Roseospira marina]MBB4315375.1 hypothetical protein [Roseospira marina]MBB5088480.1 hypothetical protein [Roseospira marina]